MVFRYSKLYFEIFIYILDERRVVAGKVLHSGCVICVECRKSIGEGAFEQVDLI